MGCKGSKPATAVTQQNEQQKVDKTLLGQPASDKSVKAEASTAVTNAEEPSAQPQSPEDAPEATQTKAAEESTEAAREPPSSQSPDVVLETKPEDSQSLEAVPESAQTKLEDVELKADEPSGDVEVKDENVVAETRSSWNWLLLKLVGLQVCHASESQSQTEIVVQSPAVVLETTQEKSEDSQSAEAVPESAQTKPEDVELKADEPSGDVEVKDENAVAPVNLPEPQPTADDVQVVGASIADVAKAGVDSAVVA